METGKKVFLGFLGFILGVIVFSLFLAGISFTAAGIVANLVFSPQSAEWAEEAEGFRDIGSVESELSRFLQKTEIGRQIILKEGDVNRVITAALGRAINEAAGGDVRVEYVAVNLSPGYIEYLASFSIKNTGDYGPSIHVKPFQGTVRGGVFVTSSEEELLLEIDFLEIGRLPFPLGLIPFPAPGDLDLANPDSLRLVSTRPLVFALPLGVIESELPSMVGLRDLRVAEEAFQLDLILKTEAVEMILGEAAELLKKQGAEFEIALEKAAEAGVSREKVIPAIEASRQLAALSGKKEPVPPAEPSAFIGYLENSVTVQPVEGPAFTPRIGDDLFQGAVITTGKSSFAELILRDDSVVKIAEETVFRLERIPQRGESSDTILELLSGKVRAKVAKVISEDSTFEIRTASIVMGVRGTDLVVQFDQGKNLLLLVLEGKVAIAPPSAEETLVNRGEKAEAGTKELEAGLRKPLETEELTSREVETVEREVPVRISAEEEGVIRREVSYLEVIDQIKEIAAVVMALEPEEQEILGKQVQSFVNMKEVERKFNELTQYPEFEELMKSLGVEEFPSP